MRTSGYGNDGLMILVPVGVSAIIGTVLFGGPAHALEAVNGIVRDVVHHVLSLVSAWL
ncbi:MAG TPA: hypothetical protein VFT39_14195 [Vicinamibacterales bacterium]|nr:hypothetical protein [Vicinamibacterales bacterium]